MSKQTYYTAVGHFKRRINSHGQSYPVIIINQMEYCVDIQEMALWTALNWRLLDLSQIEAEYHKLDQDCAIPALRTLEDCLGRLCTRGLVASGTGATDFEALYDLLGGLYVVPLSESLPLRVAAFLKLTVLRGIPVAKARELFRRDRPSEQEAQVMALSRQALLSTAELINAYTGLNLPHAREKPATSPENFRHLAGEGCQCKRETTYCEEHTKNV